MVQKTSCYISTCAKCNRALRENDNHLLLCICSNKYLCQKYTNHSTQESIFVLHQYISIYFFPRIYYTNSVFFLLHSSFTYIFHLHIRVFFYIKNGNVLAIKDKKANGKQKKQKIEVHDQIAKHNTKHNARIAQEKNITFTRIRELKTRKK